MTKQREEFEEFMNANCNRPVLAKNSFGIYEWPDTESMWLTWRAAQKSMEKNSFLNQLRNTNKHRSKTWCGTYPHTTQDIIFCALELCGEAGEAAEIAKKIWRNHNGWPGGLDFEEAEAAMIDEVGDILISLDRLASIFDINLETAAKYKFNKTSRKHGFPTFDEGA